MFSIKDKLYVCNTKVIRNVFHFNIENNVADSYLGAIGDVIFFRLVRSLSDVGARAIIFAMFE